MNMDRPMFVILVLYRDRSYVVDYCWNCLFLFSVVSCVWLGAKLLAVVTIFLVIHHEASDHLMFMSIARNKKADQRSLLFWVRQTITACIWHLCKGHFFYLASLPLFRFFTRGISCSTSVHYDAILLEKWKVILLYWSL